MTKKYSRLVQKNISALTDGISKALYFHKTVSEGMIEHDEKEGKGDSRVVILEINRTPILNAAKEFEKTKPHVLNQLVKLQGGTPTIELKTAVERLTIPTTILSACSCTHNDPAEATLQRDRVRNTCYSALGETLLNSESPDHNEENFGADNGDSQSNPSTQHEGPDNEANISPYVQNAFESYEHAMEQNPSLKTDWEVYKHLELHGFDDYKLPKFLAWQRYLRLWRNHCNSQKNTPRNDRPLFRSIVPQDQI